MSEEQLKAFLEKVQGDTSLQEQLKAEGADPVAIAKAAGFEIPSGHAPKDLLRHASEEELEGVSELSDEELEGVSGGGEICVYNNSL
ncbi:Nif11-like leader peptide family natural product precursor [Synechococcus sp. UW179A]|uniref:Nif11-like leader peptide family natural product precursor n=1 Tax=Synechococcus sp. UW179A TaxID=2575510 RepID=UPI000E0F7FFA|nr:Nif11-like leader peptide family natural product precursor [Synechococcus sp. UW179A]